MDLSVKRELAYAIAGYFTTREIKNVFAEEDIVIIDTGKSAKWEMVLDGFSKLDNPLGILKIVKSFCHPLNFKNNQDQNARSDFIKKLNNALDFANFMIEPTSVGINIYSVEGEKGIMADSLIQFNKPHYKTSTDYIVGALDFFKSEYNKTYIKGLEYEYALGETLAEEETEEFIERKRAIEKLKNSGFITNLRFESRDTMKGDLPIVFAICKIDESQLVKSEGSLPATDAGVQQVAQEVIHKYVIDNGDTPLKIAIAEIPKLQVEDASDSNIQRARKKISLPKFKRTDWSKVTIRFLTDRDVFIDADNKQKTSDYESLGFADQKSDKPNKAWLFFYGLALNNGETPIFETHIPETTKQYKKQVSDLLKNLFKNDTDPFYDSTETRTYKLKIRLIPPEPEIEKDKGISSEIKDIFGKYNS